MNPVDVALGLIRREGRWFLQRRNPSNPVLPGLWEFPGGKVQAREPLEEALRRELREEVAWEPQTFTALEVIEGRMHEGAGRLRPTVRLRPFLCDGPGFLHTRLAWGWFTLAEMRRLPMPAANALLLERLRG